MPRLPETYQFARPVIAPVTIQRPNTSLVQTTSISSRNPVPSAIDATARALQAVKDLLEGIGREQASDVDQENRYLRQIVDKFIQLTNDLSIALTEISAVVNGLVVVDPILGNTFKQGVSYFGVASFAKEDVQTDLSQLAFDGFNMVRFWARWDQAGEANSPLDANGNPNGEAWERLRYAMKLANQLQMCVDLTLPSDLWSSWDAHVNAAETITRELADIKFWVTDLSNEANTLTANDVLRLWNAVKNIDPERLAFVSLSGTTPADQANRYSQIIDAGALLDLVAPHFIRDADASAKTGERVDEFQESFAALGHGRPCLLQEEFRRGDESGVDWQAEDFFTAAQQASIAGARGWYFHTEAGYDGADGPMFEQFDEVEVEVEAGLRDALAEA